MGSGGPAQPGFFGRHDNVYLYIPNLIGYLRIVFSLYSFAVALRDPTLCFVLYFLSFVCDELDGRFARMLGQQSTLGAVLDMVTDRVSTAGLLCVLCILFPRAHFVFLFLMILDIFSHWFQTYSTTTTGATTHKDVNSSSWLVRRYYTHREFMGYCCISCEVLYLMLYLLRHPQYRAWPTMQLALPAALAAPLKGVIVGGRIPLALLLLLVCVPGFAMKQVINCFQLKVAMKMLVAHDRQAADAKRS